MSFRNGLGVSLMLISATAAQATSSKDAAYDRMAQELTSEITGTLNTKVDRRIGEASATIAGCQLIPLYLDQATELVTQVSASKGVQIPKQLEQMARGKVMDRLASTCSEKDLLKKFGEENVVVGKQIAKELIPIFEKNKDALLAGDYRSVMSAVNSGAGAMIYRLFHLGRVPMNSPEMLAFADGLRSLKKAQLEALALTLKHDWQTACGGYSNRYPLDKVRNDLSNAIEGRISPLETNIEKAYEKIVGNSFSDLLRDPALAITKHDSEMHVHRQHKLQNDACYETEAKMEHVNRQLRGIAVGQVTSSVTAREARATNQGKNFIESALITIQKTEANAAARDRAVLAR